VRNILLLLLGRWRDAEGQGLSSSRKGRVPLLARLLRLQTGASLLEVVVATAILSLASVAFLGALSTALTVGVRVEETSLASSQAVIQLESALAQPYAEPPDYSTVPPPAPYMVVTDTFVISPTLEQRLTVNVSSDLRDVLAVSTHKVNTSFVASPAQLLFVQRDFRWYENISSLTPTVPLAAENTPYSVQSLGQVYRLRMSVQAGSQPLAASQEAFKLQYATDQAGPWTDIGGIGSAAIWRGADVSGIADADTLPSVVLTNSDVPQSFEEEGPSRLNPNPAAAGEWAEWDWAVQENGAPSNANFYFRMVLADGTPLGGYMRYPSISMPPALTVTQDDYRWYANADALDPVTPLEAVNTPYSASSFGAVYRLRMGLALDGLDLPVSGQAFKLQYATDPAGPWTDVAAPGSASAAWRGFDNPSVADDAAITSILLPDSAVLETYEEAGPSALNPNAVAVDQQGEWDWAVQDYNAAPSTTYYFRMVFDDGTPLDGYVNYAAITTAAPTVIASDDFESGDASGGTGWLGGWDLQGDAQVVTQGQPQQGSYHLRLRRANGEATRQADLSGMTSATLQFWAKAQSWECSESATLSVSADGVSFTVVHAWVAGVDDDGVYKFYQFDLSSYGLSSAFHIRFEADMGQTSDQFYVDEVSIVGY
jgi:hypothetical protein